MSYLQLANNIKKPTACRAVAQANGANQIAMVIFRPVVSLIQMANWVAMVEV